MEFNAKEFKKDIITKRKIDNDLSMAVASEQIGISQPTLSRIEKGKTPEIDTFIKVCNWLGTEPNKYFIVTATPQESFRP